MAADLGEAMHPDHMRPRIGIALGGGAARGWAHIGVLNALAERGIVPTVVSGASIGSLVGAAFAADRLAALEAWVTGLRRLDVLKLLDASLVGGVIEGNRVMDAVKAVVGDHSIEDLRYPYGAVATDLQHGRTVWLREGSSMDAVRASCAMPGLFPPFRYEETWLVDGGLVDPVPITLCRVLGAEVVIAVNLSPYRRRLAGRQPLLEAPVDDPLEPQQDEGSYIARLQHFVRGIFESAADSATRQPALIDVMSSAINIMQERIARSRLAGDPPEIEITPSVQDIGMMDFHRAAVGVERGRQAVEDREDELSRLAPRA
jgi:NTE family protein